jgi:hypothetical protein
MPAENQSCLISPPVIPGRREAASPESMNTNCAKLGWSVSMDSGLAGFARDPE